jgi:hypothetical protein
MEKARKFPVKKAKKSLACNHLFHYIVSMNSMAESAEHKATGVSAYDTTPPAQRRALTGRGRRTAGSYIWLQTLEPQDGFQAIPIQQGVYASSSIFSGGFL